MTHGASGIAKRMTEVAESLRTTVEPLSNQLIASGICRRTSSIICGKSNCCRSGCLPNTMGQTSA